METVAVMKDVTLGNNPLLVAQGSLGQVGLDQVRYQQGKPFDRDEAIKVEEHCVHKKVQSTQRLWITKEMKGSSFILIQEFQGDLRAVRNHTINEWVLFSFSCALSEILFF